jgi:cobalt-zinc-cadmium efflux system outer membrane protein
VRWRDSSPGSNPEIELTWDVMELIRRSKRRNLANAEMNRIAYQVSDRALAFAAEVRTAFYDYQAAEHVRRMRVEVHRAAKASADLSSRQRSSGNISELERALEQSVYQDARLDLLRSEGDAASARTNLARALGLAAADTTWSVEAELPELPESDPPVDTLQALAMQNRFDVMAAKTELDASRRDVSYRKSYRLPSLEIGVDAEREFEEEWAYGPIVHMAIPLFDRGQGGVDRAEARVRQAEHGVASLQTRVRNDVRGSWERLRAARGVAEIYRNDVIPTREKVVEESQRHYNYMLVGPMTLLQAKRDEIEAYQNYIQAVRDYWTARAELERAVAQRIEELE